MATGIGRDTREAILDSALDLFVEKGYEATSLREVAARVGISKAALYHHFPSKGDILVALHLRLHDVLGPAMRLVGTERPSLADWRQALREVAHAMLANRKLLSLQVRSHPALEEVLRTHDPEGLHQQAQDRLEEGSRRFFADTGVPIEARVRVAAGLGVVMTMSMNLIDGAVFSPEEIAGPLERILDEILPTGEDGPPG
jgi:AcrR family transcriptional regulator